MANRLPRSLIRIMAVAAVAVVAAVIFMFVTGSPCGHGMRYNDGVNKECLGVTDGEYHFNDPPQAKNDDDRKIMRAINAAQDKIKDENRQVAKEERYVKIVLVGPLTATRANDHDSAFRLDQIRNSLEGAYTALYRVNHSDAFESAGIVKIQLLLANQGSRQDAGDDLVKEITDVSDRDHRLVAVVGLGSSLASTEVLVHKLGRKGIPMMGAINSADSLTGQPLFWSISPSNQEYVTRIRDLLDHKRIGSAKFGLIVNDTNPDPYSNSLAKDFRKHLRPYLKFRDLPYVGGTLDQPAVPRIFSPLVTNICNAVNDRRNPLDTIFYAGRVADFRYFASALEERVCRNHPLTVLTGATGFAAARQEADILRRGNIKVGYVSSSDADALLRGGPGTPQGFPSFVQSFRANGYGTADLADGMAIAHHDAVATAAVAIRLATPARDLPKPATVASQFPQIVLAHVLKGASGDLSFPSSNGGRSTGRGDLPIRWIQ